jgi:hypothetical protein
MLRGLSDSAQISQTASPKMGLNLSDMGAGSVSITLLAFHGAPDWELKNCKLQYLKPDMVVHA